MVTGFSPKDHDSEARYMAYFHELDAWTEYWDIYHPESHGHFYFGDGEAEPGLLTQFLPRNKYPPVFTAWTRQALSLDTNTTFIDQVRTPQIAAAVMEVDNLLTRLFKKYFGDAGDPRVHEDYLEAMFRFAINTLPPALERDARIADDPRKATAGHHTLAGDIMWFAWALQIEGSHAVVGEDENHPRRTLMLAGVATGCAANFTWFGHRRTREEYHPDMTTAKLLRDRGTQWATDFDAVVGEINDLYRIREWGSPD